MSVIPFRGALRLALVICTVVLASGCAEQAPAGERAATAPDASQLFARACARCHSADGSGGLPMAANGPRPTNFHDSAWQASRSDAEIVAAIRDGRGAMPPFADLLKPDKITSLAAHVRSLRGGR